MWREAQNHLISYQTSKHAEPNTLEFFNSYFIDIEYFMKSSTGRAVFSFAIPFLPRCNMTRHRDTTLIHTHHEDTIAETGGGGGVSLRIATDAG